MAFKADDRSDDETDDNLAVHERSQFWLNEISFAQLRDCKREPTFQGREAAGGTPRPLFLDGLAEPMDYMSPIVMVTDHPVGFFVTVTATKGKPIIFSFPVLPAHSDRMI